MAKKEKKDSTMNITSSQKQPKVKDDGTNNAKFAANTTKREQISLFGHIKHLQQYLKEVASEFRKISWPERTQVGRETISVLFLVTVITLMVLGFDWILSNVVFSPLELWARAHGGGIGHG